MNSLQKPGGIAALLHAAAYVVGMVLGFALIFPLLDATPDQYLTFVSENQTLVYLWNLITYWGSAITLVIMVLALYERQKDSAPALSLTAAAFGLMGGLDHRQRQPHAAQHRRCLGFVRH